MNLIGKKFHRLTVLSIHSKGHSTKWNCKCKCGNTAVVTTSSLINENTKSCGCLRLETAKTLRQRTGGNTLPHGVSHFNKIFYQYKKDALKRNLDFKLSKEQFQELIVQNCHYCNAKPSSGFVEKRRNGQFLHNGIDRKHSFHGYVRENCVPCCSFCNRMKMGLDYYDFIARCGTIYLVKKLEYKNA